MCASREGREAQVGKRVFICDIQRGIFEVLRARIRPLPSPPITIPHPPGARRTNVVIILSDAGTWMPSAKCFPVAALTARNSTEFQMIFSPLRAARNGRHEGGGEIKSSKNGKTAASRNGCHGTGVTSQ